VVLTYQEAVEAGARGCAPAIYPAFDATDSCDDWMLDVARDATAAVLEAVVYADLLAERNLLDRTSQANANAHMDAERRVREGKTDVERLLALSSLWQAVVSAESFEAAVNVMAQAYHETECAYGAERDALAATLARVKAEGDRCSNSKNYTVQFAGGIIREASRPRETDASSQWVLDCTLGEAVTTEGGA